VLDEETEPSNSMGQFLMNALSLAPKVEEADIERDFNNHIQDILVVSYLANSIRTQIDLSQRLATAALTMGSDTVIPVDSLRDDKDPSQRQENFKQAQNRLRGGKSQGGRGGRGGGGGRQAREPAEE